MTAEKFGTLLCQQMNRNSIKLKIYKAARNLNNYPGYPVKYVKEALIKSFISVLVTKLSTK